MGELAAVNPENWTKNAHPDAIRYVDLSNTKWGRIEATAEYQWQNAPSRAQRVLRPGDTIVGTVRPGNGSYAYITEDGLTGSTGFAALRSRVAQSREFVYLAATAGDNITELARLADGGAYPAVRPEAVVSTEIIQPPDAILREFSQRTQSLLARIAYNEGESRTLSRLRDVLLPQLISGELRLKSEMESLEEAA